MRGDAVHLRTKVGGHSASDDIVALWTVKEWTKSQLLNDKRMNKKENTIYEKPNETLVKIENYEIIQKKGQ